MNYAEAEKVLKSCGQEHVLAFWKKLSKKEREQLLAQIATIEPKNIKYCQNALAKGAEVPDSSKGKAPKVAVLKGKKLSEAVAAGEKELSAGHVAAHAPQAMHFERSKTRSGEHRCAPCGQVAAHAPQPMHRAATKRISGSARCVSGLWHHAQRSGQPLRKTTVRIPGPSCTEKRCTSVTRRTGAGA